MRIRRTVVAATAAGVLAVGGAVAQAHGGRQAAASAKASGGASSRALHPARPAHRADATGVECASTRRQHARRPPHLVRVPRARRRPRLAHDAVGEGLADDPLAPPAIPRLGVQPWGWWNEALHGVSRCGCSTTPTRPYSPTPPRIRSTSRSARAGIPTRLPRRLPDQRRGARGLARQPPQPRLLLADHEPRARPALGPQRRGLRRGPAAGRRGSSRSSSTAWREGQGRQAAARRERVPQDRSRRSSTTPPTTARSTA